MRKRFKKFVNNMNSNNKENNKKSVVCITRYNSKWKKTGVTNVKKGKEIKKFTLNFDRFY